MGSKRNTWKKLAMAIAVPGVAVGTLAGVAAAPAMAATAHPHGWIETISGWGHGSSGTVDVQASGVFHDFGQLSLNSNSPFTVVHLSHGSLYTVHNPGNNWTSVNPFSCSVTSSSIVDYTITGGTGRYWHISGHGTAAITVTGVLPRKPNHHCKTNAQPLPWTEHTTFKAQGPVHLH